MCVLSVKGSSLTVPCTLYLTPGYLCFHATLGGAPRKVEFVVAHSRRRREAPLYDEGRLDGFVDAADEAVYAEAARVFEANLRRFAPDCVS